jgi:hypothetical protein
MDAFLQFIALDRIDPSDLVIWEITSIYRTFGKHQINHSLLADQIQERDFTPMDQTHIAYTGPNMFDGQRRIYSLCNSPMSQPVDQYDDLQRLVGMISLVKRAYPKLLIFFGWSGVMNRIDLNTVKSKFSEHGIEILDECYVDWCNDKKLEFSDQMHPGPLAAALFVEQIILPRLQSLGWVT